MGGDEVRVITMGINAITVRQKGSEQAGPTVHKRHITSPPQQLRSVCIEPHLQKRFHAKTPLSHQLRSELPTADERPPLSIKTYGVKPLNWFIFSICNWFPDIEYRSKQLHVCLMFNPAAKSVGTLSKMYIETECDDLQNVVTPFFIQNNSKAT